MTSYIRHSVEGIMNFSLNQYSKCRYPTLKIFRMSDGMDLCNRCVDDSHWMDNFVYIRTELPNLIYEDFHVSELSSIYDEDGQVWQIWQASADEAKRFAKIKI